MDQVFGQIDGDITYMQAPGDEFIMIVIYYRNHTYYFIAYRIFNGISQNIINSNKSFSLSQIHMSACRYVNICHNSRSTVCPSRTKKMNDREN